MFDVVNGELVRVADDEAAKLWTEDMKRQSPALRNMDAGYSSDEVDDEALSEPSEDIKGDLVEALQEGFTFNGSFSYAKTYPAAPNPCIVIDDFGPLGLPLNPLEAQRLSTICAQAPFGKNDRTIIDKTVRDTWELDPSKVKFLNKEWAKWIKDKVVPAVREGLGVTSTHVEAQIYKLLLYETGSHFMAHQDTEKAPGMFGSIIVTLPSAYEGASIQLSHAGQTKTLDYSSTSATTPSVFAWYSDVFHAVNPVQSGYRLALSYNLLVPPHLSSVRPSLPQTARTVEAVRRVLLSWRQDTTGKAPTKLIYNLDHQYSIKNLGTGSLKGKDAHMISVLRPIAEQLQFRVYLANIELWQSGAADDEGPGYGGYDSDEDDEENPGMMEVYETTLKLENIVDLDGKDVVLEGIEVKEDQEMIPYLLSEQDADDEQYEGYQGNGAGTLEYWYRRTAIIIYPVKNELKITKRDPVEFSIERLEEKIARGWKEKHVRSKHIETILQACPQRSGDPLINRALLLLCRCAALANDVALWIRAARACGAVQHIDRLDIAGYLDGVSLFGLEGLRSLLEDVMMHAIDNTMRHTLAKRLVELCLQQEFQPHLQWASSQQRFVREHIKSLTMADVPYLLEIGQTEGMQVFSDSVVTQLEELKSRTDILIDVIRRLPKETSNWPSRDEALLHQLTTRLTTLVLSCTTPLGATQFNWNLVELVDLVAFCDEVDRIPSLRPIMDEIAESFRALVPDQKPSACTQFLLPFFGHLELEKTKSQRLRDESTVFAPLYGLMDLVFQYGMIARDFSVSRDLMLALPHAGEVKDLRTMLTPHIAALGKHDVSVLSTFSVELYKIRKTLHITTNEEREVLRDIIHQLFNAILANTTLTITEQDYQRYAEHGYNNQATAIVRSTPIEMINFCLSFGDESLPLAGLVANQLRPPAQPTLSSWFTTFFAPFILQLRNLLKSHRLQITIEPFRSILLQGIYAYVSLIVGQKPQERPLDSRLASFGCGCQFCLNMRSFILGPEQVCSVREMQRDRVHLEKQLATARALDAGIKWTTVKSGSPHQLQVTKPDYMLAPARWREKAKIATSAIQSLGDEGAQRLVLGEQCDLIFRTLGLPVPSGSAALRAPPVSSASESTAGVVHAAASTGASSLPSAKRRMVLTELASRPAKRPKAVDDADIIVLSD